MAMYFSRKGLPLTLVGGEEAYALAPLENAYWLSRGERGRITDRRLAREFPSFRDYVEMAEETKDAEMLRTIKILDSTRNLPQDLARLRQSLTSADAPMVTLCTAHRAKGLEWPWVYLMDDFPDVLSPDLDAEARDQEINLLYVAATRAQEHLVLNEQAEAVVRYMARQRRRLPA
ncbi:3'-5' exonuclease [Halomonas sp. LBP4]|uniref:3'-5' exonuclease n=1 Tax=Halomonas sp. LBP4 TaxID=2044917 RepID=UPI0015E8C32A|nr:3'-5' exonuclease [Halomonas sp. LBP4]